jgi:TolB-like protein/lipoprotein NlpI
VLCPIDFIYKEKGVNRHLKVTDKKEDNLNHTDYSNQLNKVANAIKEIIYAFKNPTTKVDTLGSTTNQQATTRSSSKKKYSFTVLLFLVLLAGYFYFIGITKKSGTAIDKSIAVLPFVDLSQNKDQEYFSDGLSEELLSLLAKIPELKVIGRTSSFAFKGTNEDLRTIAEKLGVAHILEGSVRKSGNTLRITVQLIKAADGAHLWSETYNRTLDDIFKVQDEIAGAVVGQLKLKLLQDAMPAPKAMKPEAYNLYLEAKFFFGMRSKESYLKALAKLQQALTIEPDAAPVWALLSEVYSSQADSGQRSVEEGYRLAREAGEKALQLDVGYAEAYASLGQVYESFDWDFVKADNAFKKALELDPANVSAMNGAAILAQDLGRLDESIELKKKCIGADPLRAGSYNSISITYYYKGDWIEAEYAVRKALELVPYFGNGYYGLSKIQLAAGKYESALYSVMQERDEFWKACGLPLVYFSQDRKSKSNEALQKTIEKFANEGAIQIAEVYAWRNEKDKAFEWLERAFTQHDPGLAAMLPDPLLKNLHTDVRWLPFLTKMKLVVYWGEYKEKYLK